MTVVAIVVERFIERKLGEIAEVVGGEKAVVAVSGGVDSTVCAVLAQRALGDRSVAIFIDDGLMREGEPEAVVSLSGQLGLQIKLARVTERFFEALRGIEDPEEKRKAFRHVFYQVLGELVQEEEAHFLVQGTIAADVVETRGGIKTQHNVLEQVGISPEEYGFSVIEPLTELYKPEVREVAQALGLPSELSERMPFPGPGLAVRVVGEVTPARVHLVRQATTIVEEEILSWRTDPGRPFQALAVLLNDKATGVVGGTRAFGSIVVVRIVNSKDAITATPTDVPRKVRDRIVERITDRLPSVVKVLFDETPKPPSTIEFV